VLRLGLYMSILKTRCTAGSNLMSRETFGACPCRPITGTRPRSCRPSIRDVLSCVPRGSPAPAIGGFWSAFSVPRRVGAPCWIESTQVSWLSLSVGFPARVRSCRRSINRASSSINSGLLCLPPLWISNSLCINSAKFSMTSSKAGKAGWLAEMIGRGQGRKLVKREQFYSIA
jgi:hypothetical protein